MNLKRATVLLLCAVAPVMAMVGCTSGQHASKPGDLLSYGGLPQDGIACVPATAGVTDATYGFTSVNNVGALPITLTGVELLGAEGLAIDAAYMLPISSRADVGAIGNSAAWPPQEWQLKYVPGALSKLTDLNGFVVPSKANAEAAGVSGYNVVLHLKVSHTPAAFKALRIGYVDKHGDVLYQDTTVSIEIRVPCDTAAG